MLKRQVSFFVLVGLAATFVDLATYLLLSTLGIERSISKGVSYICGVYLGYLGNTRFTFLHSRPSIKKYVLVYIFSMAANILINDLSFSVTQSIIVSWLTATFSSMFLNFVGLRHFAFREKV